MDMVEVSSPCQAVCLAEKEGGHEEAYLTWVHQKGGLCYFRCDSCGWIKLDTKD